MKTTVKLAMAMIVIIMLMAPACVPEDPGPTFPDTSKPVEVPSR